MNRCTPEPRMTLQSPQGHRLRLAVVGVGLVVGFGLASALGIIPALLLATVAGAAAMDSP